MAFKLMSLYMVQELLEYKYQDFNVEFTSTGFINATQIAKKFNKNPKDFIKNKSTNEYIEALASHLDADRGILLSVIKGGDGEQGTFLHPKLGLKFAQWLDPNFAIWCDTTLENLLKPKIVPVQPIKRSNIGLLKEMVNELELQSMRIEQVESEVVELRTQISSIDSKPALSVTVTSAKAFRTLKQDKLDEIGREINQLVFRLFKTDGDTFQNAHSKAQATFKQITGETYIGAKKASFQSKLQFLEWLKKI